VLNHTTETGLTEMSELWAIATVARAAAAMMERMVASCGRDEV